MADLTKDLRIGKKFSRHDELKERQRQQRAKARLEKLMPGVTEVLEQRPAAEEAPRAATVPPATPTPTAGEPSEPAPVGAASQLAAGAVAGVPQIQIVNGQIVVDQRSLVLDRHAAGAHAARGMEVIVEDEFTRLTTSNTYMKPSKQLTNHWSTADTERFYEALHRHGTEFEMIARYFPGRQRRHIKLKFNREERVNPGRINATLRMHLQRPAPINLAEFRVMSGLKLAPLEEIEAEHRRREEEHERERLRVEHETAEAARKKREALFADDPSAAASAPEATSSTSAGDAASGTTAVAAPSADGDQATGATPSQPSASALTGAAPATAGPSSSLANGTRASRSRTSRAAAAEDAATASATAAAATPSTTVEMAAAQARDEEEGPDAQLERETSDAAAADTAISEPGPSVAADDVVDSEPTTAGAALRIRGKSRGSFKPRGGRGGMATSGRGRGGATVNTRSRG